MPICWKGSHQHKVFACYMMYIRGRKRAFCEIDGPDIVFKLDGWGFYVEKLGLWDCGSVDSTLVVANA